MGEVFRYVSDSALAKHRLEDLPCPLCGKTGGVFHIQADVEFPGEGQDRISEACASCIRNLAPDCVQPLNTERRLAAYLTATPDLGKDQARLRLAAIVQELRRTPRLPHSLGFSPPEATAL